MDISGVAITCAVCAVALPSKAHGGVVADL
jgi:hypothetical protein